MDQLSTEHPFFGDLISVYAREQALEDGVLIDAGPMAREAGFRWPLAITAAAWADCVAWTEADCEALVHQDQSGRLWDLLFMAAHAVRAKTSADTKLLFELYRVPRDGNSTEAELVTLKLVVGPGDVGEPVMTVLLPQED